MDKRFFLISGLFSISIYLLTIAIGLYFLNNLDQLKKFAIKQKSIEVSLLEAPKIKKEFNNKKEVKKVKKSQVENKKTKNKKVGSRSPKEQIDISKLFSTINKSKKVKNSQNSKKSSFQPSRFKGEGSKKSELAQNILKKMDIKDVSKILAKTNIESVDGEYDQYFSKIYEILYKYWLPSQESAGNRAKVKIIIDIDGKFDYNILLFSSSEVFNKELVEYLEYLKIKKFPAPKDGKKEITVFFEAKE